MGQFLALGRPAGAAIAMGLSAALLLGGCGPGAGTGGLPLAGVMAKATQILGGRSARTTAQAGGQGQPTEGPRLRVRLAARGIDTLLTLRDSDSPVETWAAPGGITFTLRAGLLIETRGLGSDLLSAMTPDPAQLAKAGQDYGRTYYVSGPDLAVETRVYRCATEALGPEALTVGGLRVTALHLRETCLRDSGKLTSDYWLDGQVLRKSRQWVSPGVGYAEFETIDP